MQADKASRPDGIVLEPVGGTGLPQVARAATAAGIGWAVLNRELDYIRQLRQATQLLPPEARQIEHGELTLTLPGQGLALIELK